MRRSPVSVVALSLLLIVVVGFGLAQHRAGGAPAGAQASPVPGVELLDIVQVEPAATPAQHVVLTRVTLAPGEGQGPHPHGGTSILYVESGTICFTVTDMPGFTVRVTAAASSATPDDGCEPPDAAFEAGRDLDSSEPGVLLAAGDSVTQGQTTAHRYANVGTEPAVVLISELQTDGSDPCSGGCG